MDLHHILIIFAAGALAGIMNAIAGGGTIITFPALIFCGIPSIPANATSTVALLPSALGYTYGYRKNIPAVRGWIRLLALVSIGGGFIGGILLVRTPPAIFDRLVPYLILLATVLFTANNFIQPLLRLEARAAGSSKKSQVATAIVVIFQFLVSIYGGYFGAGAGILMLAALGMMGMSDIHEMNTVKGILGFLINIVAAIYFGVSGLVDWRAALIMSCGSILGAVAGAHFAQRIPQKAVRYIITGIGFVLAVLMFVKQMKG